MRPSHVLVMDAFLWTRHCLQFPHCGVCRYFSVPSVVISTFLICSSFYQLCNAVCKWLSNHNWMVRSARSVVWTNLNMWNFICGNIGLFFFYILVIILLSKLKNRNIQFIQKICIRKWANNPSYLHGSKSVLSFSFSFPLEFSASSFLISQGRVFDSSQRTSGELLTAARSTITAEVLRVSCRQESYKLL